tara:strand:+ start:882 stop:1394 length:513 start_codon:yes stop_codon:yes gene_type:complete
MKDKIHSFIKEIKDEYDRKIQVVIIDEDVNSLQINDCKLKVLESLIISAMHIKNPDFQHIKLFKDIKTRRRRILIWMQIHSYLGVELGYSKTYVGKSVNRDHATVIHRHRTVENLLGYGERDMTEAYKLVIKTIKEYVGIISTNTEGKNDTKSVLNALRDKEESIITVAK